MKSLMACPNKFKQSNRAWNLSIFFALVISFSGTEGFTQELPMPPEGPAKEVNSIDSLPLITPSFEGAGEDDPVEPASVLPTDIQPAPMPLPEPQPASSAQTTDTVTPVFHDLRTGETTYGDPIDANAVTIPTANGGFYPGADGGAGLQENPPTPAAFPAPKTLVSAIGGTGINPYRMSVKVAFRFGSSWFVCSGAMRDIRTVQTAGHCIHDGGGGNGNFADEVIVYPGWDGSGSFIPFNPDLETHGAANGIFLASVTEWVDDNNIAFDFGIIALDRAVGALTGWFGWDSPANPCDGTLYNVESFPAESCGGGLHNGADMYSWQNGPADICFSSINAIQYTTTAGCLTAMWGGESGSNLYKIDGQNLLTVGIASTSNRTTLGRYRQTISSWTTFVNGTFIPNTGRGNTFDLQPLDAQVTGSTTIPAGGSVTTFNHLAANGTNGTDSDTYNYSIYLSTNDNITTSDTLLSNQNYTDSFSAVESFRVNANSFTIPSNTPQGTYYLGVIYDNATDSNSANNDTDDWDTVEITVDPPSGGCSGESTTIINPGNTTTDLTPTYQWTASDCAEAYVLILFDLAIASGSIPPVFTDTLLASEVGCASGTGTCSYTDAAALNPKGYVFVVIPFGGGEEGDTEFVIFDICGSTPSDPALVSPSGSIGTNTPTYVWNASSGASAYIVWSGDGLGTTYFNGVVYPLNVGCPTGAGTCSYSPGVSIPGSALWVSVAYSQCGSSGFNVLNYDSPPPP